MFVHNSSKEWLLQQQHCLKHGLSFRIVQTALLMMRPVIIDENPGSFRAVPSCDIAES